MKIWAMWQTKYASVVPKNLGVDFRLFSVVRALKTNICN